MFVFLSKFLPLFVYPVGLTFLLLWAAYSKSEDNQTVRELILAMIVILWIAGNSWTTMALTRSLEW